jgi:hypothetical protein
VQATAIGHHRSECAEAHAGGRIKIRSHHQILFQNANADLMRSNRAKTGPDVRKSLHSWIDDSRLWQTAFTIANSLTYLSRLFSLHRRPFIQTEGRLYKTTPGVRVRSPSALHP